MIHINDASSYKRVVLEFSNMLYRIAYQNLLNIEDAEDIIQDVFLELLQYKKPFHDQEHLKAWLIRVTINKCINLKKRHFRHREIPLEDHDIAFNNEERELIYEIGMLPRDERNIIYLYYYEGYSIKEIAVILNRNQNTINSKLTRARKKLKKLLLGGELKREPT